MDLQFYGFASLGQGSVLNLSHHNLGLGMG